MASPDFFLSGQEVTDTHIPKPPPLPIEKIFSKTNYRSMRAEFCRAKKEFLYDGQDKIFKEGCGADVYICTDDESIIPAHFRVLSGASPRLGKYIQRRSTVKNGIRHVKIPRIPREAFHAFLCFLYSSCYEEDVMKKHVLQLLILSHSFSVSSLKKVCIHYLEQGWLGIGNAIQVLQIARNCDAPRLSFICCRMIVMDFENIASTQAWKVKTRDDPSLEQHLMKLVADADSRKKERLRKKEEKKVYLQLHEAMEALLHICKDGCRTIGPTDKVLKGSQFPCNFPACKGLETLVRHFSICKTRVPGGCAHCKRLWHLLQLHSRMCNTPDYCKVPLCRNFKEKMQQQMRKDDTKWKLLVCRVLAAKRAAQGPFSSRRSAFL